MKHPLFHGSAFDLATVGERGQVVIPAKVRKEIGLKPGDQVMVISGLKGMSAILINARYMSKVVSDMHRSIEKVEERILGRKK